MADIFISYAHADKSRTRELAAWLEAQGYTVWWDTALRAGDDFQTEIHKQIWPAKAVIVLWSAASAASVWVRAEAIAAQRDNKLIPVKFAETAYEDIVPPFNLLHTENFDDRESIRRALDAQMSKPTPTPRLFKQLRYETIAWLGIIGSAITVFTGFDALIRMARWARQLTEHWSEITLKFWTALSSLVGVEFPNGLARTASFLLFFCGLVVSSTLSSPGNRWSVAKTAWAAFLSGAYIATMVALNWDFIIFSDTIASVILLVSFILTVTLSIIIVGEDGKFKNIHLRRSIYVVLILSFFLVAIAVDENLHNEDTKFYGSLLFNWFPSVIPFIFLFSKPATLLNRMNKTLIFTIIFITLALASSVLEL